MVTLEASSSVPCRVLTEFFQAMKFGIHHVFATTSTPMGLHGHPVQLLQWVYHHSLNLHSNVPQGHRYLDISQLMMGNKDILKAINITHPMAQNKIFCEA